MATATLHYTGHDSSVPRNWRVVRTHPKEVALQAEDHTAGVTLRPAQVGKYFAPDGDAPQGLITCPFTGQTGVA